MEEIYNELLTSVFFQSMEFIVAPMVLVLLTHFVNDKEDKLKALGDKTREYTFISLYSNLLFFFSLSAHNKHIIICPCYEVQLALLLNCIFLSFIVIIHKHIQTEVESFFLKLFFKWLWLGVLFLIFYLIIYINIHLNNLEFSFEILLLGEFIMELLRFFISPNHLLLLLFMITVIVITITEWQTRYQKSTMSFQNLDENSSNLEEESKKEKNINLYKKLATNTYGKPEIRANSYFYLAKHYFDSSNIELAYENITKSKAIAVNIPYSEIFLLPIRILKMSIHKKLNQITNAQSELQEVKMEQDNATEKQKKTLKYCVDQLTEELNK